MIQVFDAIKPGESVQTLARLCAPSDQAYTQSAVSSVSVAVYESAALATTLWTGGALVVSTVFFNTLQTGDGWEFADGFNFKHVVPSASVTGGFLGGHAYLIRYTVTTVQDGVRVMDHWVEVL